MRTSLQNAQVKQVVALQRRRDRDESKKFLVEGWRFVEEAIRCEADIEQVFVCPASIPQGWNWLVDEMRARKLLVEEVDERVMRKMSTTEQPQGVLAIVRQRGACWDDLTINAQTVLLIIDRVQDPGNLGTIIRTALAAGITQVCLTEGTVDLYNPKVLRSTMGAIFSMRILQDIRTEEVLDFLQAQSIRLITADVEGKPLYGVTIGQLPIALVVGNEGKGPAEAFKRASDVLVTIPMYNQVESLNVGMATGILLYEIVRQRDFL